MKLYCVNVFESAHPHAFVNMALSADKARALHSMKFMRGKGYETDLEEIHVHNTPREYQAALTMADEKETAN